MTIRWHLEVHPIDTLKEHSKNPRYIKKEQIKQLEYLIKTFGLIDKPIINADKTIIGGHQRIKILKKMKAKVVECWVPERQLEPEEIDRLCIGLNLNQGEWDFDILANEWDVDNLLEWGFSIDQLMGHKFEDETKTSKSDECEDDKCLTCGQKIRSKK